MKIERIESRESIEGQQTTDNRQRSTDNARANERNKSSLLISQRRRDMLASVATVARYESATCDEGRFISPEECALAPLALSPQPLGRWPKGKAKESLLRSRINGQ